MFEWINNNTAAGNSKEIKQKNKKQREAKLEKPASLNNRTLNEVVAGKGICLESKRPRHTNGIEDCRLARSHQALIKPRIRTAQVIVPAEE